MRKGTSEWHPRRDLNGKLDGHNSATGDVLTPCKVAEGNHVEHAEVNASAALPISGQQRLNVAQWSSWTTA